MPKTRFIAGKSGDEPVGLVDPLTGDSGELLVNADINEIFDEMRSLSDEDLLGRYGISDQGDMESKIAGYWSEKQEEETEIDDFWAAIDENSERILKLSDAEVDEKFLATKSTSWKSRSRVLYGGEYWNLYEMPAVFRTRWSGWCAPSAMAWVYFAEGFRDHTYNGVKLLNVDETGFTEGGGRGKDDATAEEKKHSIVYSNEKDGGEHTVHEKISGQTGFYYFGNLGDRLDKAKVRARSKKIDGGLYADLMEWGKTYASGGTTFPGHFYTMAKNMTGGSHEIVWTPFWDNIHDNIYRKKVPALVSAQFYNYKKGEKKYHIITLAGTIQVDRYWWEWFIFRINRSARERRMYLAHDNGSVTSRENSKLTPAGSHKAGKYVYRNPYRYVPYYPYWFDEHRIRALTSIPYLFR